jgi:hypothetical protein
MTYDLPLTITVLPTILPYQFTLIKYSPRPTTYYLDYLYLLPTYYLFCNITTTIITYY